MARKPSFFKSRKVFVFAFLHWSLRKWMTVLHASCWQAVSSIACCLVKWYLEHQGSPTSGPWAWSSLPRLARQSGHKNIILYWGVLTKQNISVSNILGLKRRVIRQYYTTYGCSLWLTNCNKWTSEFFKCCVHAHKTTYSSCAPPPTPEELWLIKKYPCGPGFIFECPRLKTYLMQVEFICLPVWNQQLQKIISLYHNRLGDSPLLFPNNH